MEPNEESIALASSPIGIIGAMESEVELLFDEIDSPDVGDMRAGMLFGMPVVVAQCGVGMVNAAACAQRMIDLHCPCAVINTGVAGAVSGGIEVGDVIVATEAVNWLMDARCFGYEPGQVPGEDSARFPADPHLRSLAVDAAQVEGARVHEGIVASGDRFVRDAFDKSAIDGVFGALCCEMEGAAIAQVCKSNHIPCSIIRTVSDTADGAGAEDYPAFEAKAASASAKIVASMVESLADIRPGDLQSASR